MIKKELILFTLLLTNFLFSQVEKLESNYKEYFKYNREIPYLHINKTSFLKGEEVWFKAYILNSNTQKLHSKTRNLHCAIYDEKGQLKKHKMLFVDKGVAAGSFIIDSSYTDRKYFLRASTNYMKNFNEDHSFLQEIKIIDNKETTRNTPAIFKEKYDLQILPEGGHILANAINTLGIILKDNKGESLKIKNGKIIDNDNNVIKEFATNKFGLAKVTLDIKAKENYAVEITLQNNEKVLKPFPIKKHTGVSLSLDNSNLNVAKFIIRTNANTIKNHPLKKYTLFIHNTSSSLKKEIIFKKDSHEREINIVKRLIKPGTNIVTLFDNENNPLAERVFFNYQKTTFNDVSIELLEKNNDSIILNIEKIKKDNSTYFLSTSILPNSTKAYTPKNNIFSTFLLKPYIKGDIPDISYVFEKTNSNKLLDLDLLLLTQGWSKYNWHDIFNTPPIENYQFEQGINVRGTINNIDLKNIKNLLFASKENNLFLTEELKNEKLKNLKHI